MRRLAKLLVFTIPFAFAYLAWPLHSALQIREALHAGDTATLTRKIEWEELRANIKASISPETLARLEASPAAPRPTIWQRVKAVIAPKVAGNVIDRYVTPENLPTFLGYREAWRGTQRAVRPVSSSAPEAPTALAGTALAGTGLDRFASFWSRVRRAVFHSPTRFELEVEDKFRPERRYVGVFELKGWDWKLTGLAVKGGTF